MFTKKIKENQNQITFSINPRLYSLESLYGAAYVFLDRAYVFLDEDPKKNISVTVKGKEKLSKNQLENLAGEFYNELLNYSLREKISKSNQKLREYILARALMTVPDNKTPQEKRKNQENMGKKVWQKDTLGTALPWEEKYSEKRKNK